MRRMHDAAWPPADPPPWEAVAGYIGGNTPHVWTDQEWAAQPARWRLPIFTRSHDGEPVTDAAQAVSWLARHGVPKRTTLALDYETRIDPVYLGLFDAAVCLAGWRVMVYGSRRTVLQNPPPSGGYWVADWTGAPHLYPGSAATQWSGSGPFGGAYDPSLVADATPLWDTRLEDPLTLFNTVDDFKAAMRAGLGLRAGEQVATDTDIATILRGDPTHPDSLKAIHAAIGAVADPTQLAALLAATLEVKGITTDPGGVFTVTFGPKPPAP